MTRVEKTVFISYRRTNAPWALAISQNLTHNGFDVFFHYQKIGSGDFERIILEHIRARAHFLVLLAPSALERCDIPGDWLRREIEEALETKRNVVPLMLEGFDFGAPAIASKLTGKLEMLKRYNGMTVPAEYFEAAMTKLRTFLNVPLDAVLHPTSEFAQQAAKHQQAAAATAPPVPQQELTAQEWYERGFFAPNSDEKIRCYTEAIRLRPDNSAAYNNRGVARGEKGDFDGAVEDCTEAIRLDPSEEAYNNRGIVRAKKGDFDRAIEDFTEAIRLMPDDADAYYNRGLTRNKKGDRNGALEDYTMALQLNPEYAKAYRLRGLARYDKKDFEGAVEDFTKAMQFKPPDADDYFFRAAALKAKGDMGAAQQDFHRAELLKSQSDVS